MSYSPNQLLKNSVEREFERNALPFLRIIWPDLAQTPTPRGYWDQRGIDLLTSATKRPIQCCVQCKGFHVDELGTDQFQQIRDSILKFKAAQIPTKHYRLVHNRDSRNRAIVEKIELLLEGLVDSGLVETAEMWDRPTLQMRVAEKVRLQMVERIRHQSAEALARLEKLYGPSWYWQYVVPMARSQYSFRRDLPPELVEQHQPVDVNLTEALLSKKDRRWTMLTGYHGTGKTTSALLAAHQPDRIILYAECRRFRYENLGGGINALTKEIARSMEITSPEDNHHKEYDYFVGRELSRLIRQPGAEVVLIIDGLDENRYYHRTRGLSLITSQLAEARCPVILTMRKEQFDESFGDIGSSLGDAFRDFSLKNAPGREATILTLGFWSKQVVKEFIGHLMEEIGEPGRPKLERLRKAVETGDASELYGTLIFHPLYLSFIIEDVLESDIRRANRTALIERWVTRKIFRDRNVDRVAPDDTMDRTKLTNLMFELLEDVAICMVIRDGDDMALTETTAEEDIELCARGKFPSSGELTLGILLNSVLVPVGHRRIGAGFRITFVHRIFQEYFLARSLRRRGIDPEPYPREVRELYGELA